MRWSGKRIGLALGGGGARGFAHIGVLEALEAEQIPIDIIAGTSMGAIVGAAYACGISLQALRKKVDDYLASPEFLESPIMAISESPEPDSNTWLDGVKRFLKGRFYMARTMFKPGLIPAEEFQTIINYFVPDITIEETKIPFRAVATDLITGEKVVFSAGSLRNAVLASCAVPGAVDPIREGKHLLTDGGVVSLVPVHAAREGGADIVIAVVVDIDIRLWDDFGTAKGIFNRAGEITIQKLLNYELKDADVVIRPDVGKLHWTDFSSIDYLVKEGERSAKEAVGRIDMVLPFYVRWAKKAGRLFSADKSTTQQP